MGFLPFFVTSSKCLNSPEMLPSSGTVQKQNTQCEQEALPLRQHNFLAGE